MNSADSSRTDVVILCGGLGARLKSVMRGRQKVLAEISGRPFLQILVDDAVRQGFSRFVFCTGFGAEEVEKHFKNAYKKKPNLDFHFSAEPAALGTAGAIKNAESLVHAAHFFVLNGDSFCPFDYWKMLAFHEKAGAIATVALVEAEPTSEGGFVRMDENSRITGFREKSYESAHSFLNAGVYIFNRALLNRIPAGQASSMELEIFPELLSDPAQPVHPCSRGIYGFKTGGKLYDIGTPERLEAFRKEYGAKF